MTSVRRTVEALARNGSGPVVVPEPSCAAALRHDVPRLLGTAEAHSVAARIRTLAEQLDARLDAGWTPPHTGLSSVVLQTHCHERAVFGTGAQQRVLARLGVSTVNDVDGCCGLAGNFGVEQGHYEVSLAVAELALAPALRAAAGTPVLADGFSCRTQITHLQESGRGRHLAQIVDAALRSAPIGEPT